MVTLWWTVVYSLHDEGERNNHGDGDDHKAKRCSNGISKFLSFIPNNAFLLIHFAPPFHLGKFSLFSPSL